VPEHNHVQLIEGIIARAQAKKWEQAKLEWGLANIYEAERGYPETCLCGHFPIIELCVLRNRINQSTVTVGNVCVKKFIGLPSNKIFEAVKRVRVDIKRSLNDETIDYAWERGWIPSKDKAFYKNINSKRNLTGAQRAWKTDVNNRVLFGVSASRPQPKTLG
jgi:hypothetical protein